MKRLVMSICALLFAAFLVGALFWAFQLEAEAAAVILLSDDFEDGNDDGWTVQAGDWSVILEYSEYRVFYPGSGTGSRRSYYSTVTSTTWTDYSIQARMKVMTPTADNRWGMLMVRWQDSGNYYYLAFQGDGRLRIRKYVGSSSSTMGTVDPGLSRDTWYTIGLEVTGDTTPTLRAYLDGTPVLTVTDETGSPFTTGTCALGSYQGTAHFDDVVVTEGGTSTVLLSEDFDDGVADDWVVQAGDWDILANYIYRVYYPGSGTGSRRSYAGSPTWTDYSVQARMQVLTPTADNRWGMLMVRWQDSGNYYYLAFQGDGRLRIRKYVGSSSSTMGTVDPGLSRDTWYTIGLEVTGDTTPTLRALLDGTPVLTVTDETGSPFTAGQCALGSYQGTAYFDDVIVTDLSSFALTVNKAGSGGGTVTSDPVGLIDCGVTCTASLEAGTVITLSAAADPGDSFVGWMGACTGTGDCVLTMDEAKDVTAVFSSASDPTLIVYKDGPGSGTVTSDPAGIDCGTTCVASFSASTVVTLTAVGDTGSTFSGWSGGGCSGTDPCAVTMDVAKTVTATFIQGPFLLSVTKDGNGTGTVTSDPAGIDCGGTCSESFDAGTVVTLTAAADVDSAFAGWSGEGCSGTGDCVVTMYADADVTATFMSLTQTLTVDKTGNGTGTVTSDPAGIDCGGTCSADYSYGSAVTLTAAADADSVFAGWSGAGCGGTGTCTVTMNDTQDVTASFMSLTQTLTVDKTGNGTGIVTSDPAGIDCGGTCSAEFSYGTSLTLTATPDAESSFISWSGAGCSGTGTCLVTMDDTKVVTAMFKFNATLPFTDDFESGAGKWIEDEGAWSVVLENQAYRVTFPGSGTTSRRSYYDGPYASTWTDYAVQARVKVESTTERWGMIMARWQDSKNYYYLAFEDDGDLKIRKYDDGSSSTIGPTANLDLEMDKWYTLTLEVAGDTAPTLRASVDGTPVITVTDDSGSPFTAGPCALGSYRGTVQFDDIVVTVIPPFDEAGDIDLETATILLMEDFEDGVADDWVVQSGTWAVVQNHIYRHTYTDGVSPTWGRAYAGSPSWTDYSFQARVKPTAGTYAMLITRYQDAGNYYLLSVRMDNGRLQFKRMTPTGSVNVGSSVQVGITAGKWYLVKFEVEGDELRAYLDGNLVMTANDSALTWGEIGLGALRASADFDDVLATSLVPVYALTVDTTGSGSGTVTSDPLGLIDCGVTCTASLERGTVVTLTATPDGGDSFAGWMGACTGVGDCVVTMDEAKDVTAVFSSASDPMLIVYKDGSGDGTVTSEPAGIDCGSTCTYSFTVSTVVTLTANADGYSEFTGWSGEGCSGTGTCVVTMDAAKRVTATFTHVAFTLTVVKAGNGTGTVTSDPAGIDCGTICSAGMSGVVTLTATPDPMSSFAGWDGEGCSGTGTCVVTMDAARSVTATFSTYVLYLPMVMQDIQPVVVSPLYVATGGSDSNPGTIGRPYATISKAVSVAVAGQTIYVRGGTYYYNETIALSKKGNAVNMYKIWAYPGEQPVLDFSGLAPGPFSRGFIITGNFWHLKGLEIQYAQDNGIKIEGNYNIVEQCVMHHNQDTGLQIGFASTPSNADGSKAAYNQIINCDSYRNFDSPGGGNADGFACKLHAGKGNSFTGCRAWENSDDGWDLFQTYFPVTIENSWTWHNGDPALFGGAGGNGNGFKLGGNNYPAAHIVTGCIAFDNAYSSGKGFDQNHNMGGITIYNSVGWGNLTNFSLNEDPTVGNHLLRNNVSFDPVTADTELSASTVHDHNSWNLAVTASVTDFLSLDENLAKAPRQADGSLPDNGFARLVAGSDLIDAGVNVGLPYCGSAPDLGAFEYCPSPDLPKLSGAAIPVTLGVSLGTALTRLPKKRREDATKS